MTALRALWRTPRARVVTVLVLVVALLAGYLLVRPTTGTPSAETRTATVTVPGGPGEDGSVELDTTLYLPATTPAPAVLMAHGFGGSKDSVADDAEELAADGFVVLAYSARGFGRSTGSIHLNSLDHEVADGRALIDHLATLPEVSLDGPNDPKVGVTGGSYGGALSLMVAGTDPRVDAAVPLITWYDLEQALFPNGVVDGDPGPTPAALPTADDGVFKKAWASSLIASVTAGIGLTGATGTAPIDTGDSGFSRRDAEDGSGEDAAAAPGDASGGLPAGLDPASLGCGRLAADVCAAYSQAAQTGRLTPEFSELLANSSPSAVVGDITAPTLIVQGEQDTLFGLDQSDANASAIAANGTTVAMTWFNGGHDGGTADTVTRERITDWFRFHLSGEGAEPSTGFTYSLAGPLSETGRARTRTLQATGYPGIGDDPAVTRQDVALSGGAQVALHPAGGAPAGISSLPGLSGGLAGTALGLIAGGLPGQSARFTSEPVADLTVVAGAPRVTLEVTALPGAGSTPTDEAVLYVSLAEVSEGGLRTLAGNAVMPIRVTGLTPGTPTQVTVALPAVALQVEAGNRVQVTVATTDQAYAGSTAPAVYRIALVDPSVSLPLGTGERISAGEVPIALLIGLIVLLVVGATALVVVGRLRTRSSKVVGDTSIPLQITGLRKSYPGGVHAVQDVSLRVEPGQVLGLLGPNGAGKTTTLRMVMGLIQPTDGQILVFGRPIRPGAEILSRVGSFVEGSGFLPHLSGEANLDLYWKATGRPMADAHLEEALEIAGLGKAVKRRVKTYSQGMRQRLAIAQAMLGLPDLLILDEPTNGLDPPQIHAMREVLRRYAATGRTVVVSSHLLSEVEQTCSHVVVVHQGRTIAAGTVADMVATSGDMQFTLTGPDSADRAARVLSGLDGIGEVTVYEQLPHLGTVHADLGSVVPAEAVAALVGAGLPVASAAPRHRLEDVFLELVGAAAPEGGGTR